MTTLCHRFLKHTSAWPIELRQAGPEDFTVVYGKQVEENLTYAAAATRLGCAIMHALACEGKLDNSDPKDSFEA